MPTSWFLRITSTRYFLQCLNFNDQDSLNSAAGGNFLDKMPRDCLAIIESKSKVHYSRSKAIVSKVSTSSSTPGVLPDVAELKDMVKALLLNKKNQSQAHRKSGRGKELQFNLFSISQMCDKKNIVPKGGLTCLFAKATSDESKLWHRRLGHINFKTMNKLVKGNLVRGLPSKLFENNQTCVACQKGKQHRASCKSKTVSSISQPLHMLHMDLFGPTFVKSLMKKMYCLVVTDDYSRFSWVFFLATKDETSGILKSFITGVENLIDQRVKVIRCDNGTEFKNKEMNQFCERKGIKREFSVARTPQQNGVAERKNRTLIEAARTMLADSKLPTTFWAEAVNTACYVQNRVLVTKPHNKTPYELFLGRKPALGFIRPFGCPVTILNTIDHLGKFDGKADEGFFVGYSINSKAFRVFNSRTRIVEENLHVQFSKNTPNIAGSGPNWLFDIDALTKSMNYKPVIIGSQSNGNAGEKACDDARDNEKKVTEEPGGDPSNKNDSVNKTSNINTASDGNNTNNVNTVSSTVNTAGIEVNVVSSNTSIELLNDPNMPELEDIVYSDDYEDVGAKADMNNLNTFMPVNPILTTRIHKDHRVEQIIRDLNSAPQTRRMTKNLKEHGLFSLVKQRANHKDFQNYLFACFLSQEEPKKCKIKEEVYVYQPPGFEDPDFPDRVYKVEKALYGLHQAPKAWYETLSTYLLDNRFQRGKIDKTLFIRRDKGDILTACKAEGRWIFISQDKYVTEILKKFSFTNVKTASTPMETKKALLKDKDGEEVDVHLYRSMIGSLMYLTSSRPDIMFAVCACARYQVNIKVSHLHVVKRIFRYLKRQPKLGLWYIKDSPFDLVAYPDRDYARASLDKKSTTRGCQFLGCRLISWQCKKQTMVTNSTTEAEYVAALSCFGQEDGIFISQDKYVTEILKKFGFTDVKTASTPMETQKPLLKDEDGEEVDVHLYRSMIGSLMYLTSSRPDIMFAVCACARYQVNPKVSHLHAVKRIFRYLKGQPKLGLWYPKDSPFDLVAYTDSDYAGASLDRKSTTGGCQFLGCRLISWQCKKQTVVANSTTEAEYVAASSCCGQVLWIQNQLLDYGYNFMHTKIYIDNESTICIVKNPVFHSKTKHIEIRHHFIKDSNEKKLIQMIKIHTNKNVANLLTKAFDLRIGVNTGDSKLMPLGINLLLLGKVNAARHNLLLLVVKAVNGEQQLQALVDGKKIIITEATVRRDLQLEDDDVVDCLPNAIIFEQLTLMGVGRSARVVSSKEASLGDQDDATKQGRKIDDIDKDAEITLVNET
ncbi:putative ribonuclease H-like domain-containing protein [Tanacetum coccineum]